MNDQEKPQLGFTIIEVAIVVAILILVVSIIWVAFRNINSTQGVKRASDTVRSVLEDARSRTLASRDDSRYGVHFALGSTTLFAGTSFSEGGLFNEVGLLPRGVEISSISLTGGTNDVVFERLTGAVSATGTVTISLVSDVSQSSTITMQETGLIIIE